MENLAENFIEYAKRGGWLLAAIALAAALTWTTILVFSGPVFGTLALGWFVTASILALGYGYCFSKATESN